MAAGWTFENGIGRLTLGPPPSNTMTLGFFREFRDRVADLPSLSGLRAIVIGGEGRHFSSGADVDELLALSEPGLMMENYRAFLALEELHIPVIAAIRGVCLGSALELALFCHFRICADDAVLGLPETTFNLMPGIGGIQRLAALAGEARAIELILRGNTFTAAEAFTAGLADATLPKRGMDEKVMALAGSLPLPFRREDRALILHKFIRKIHVAG